MYFVINLVARLSKSLEDEGERRFTACFILFVSKGDFRLLGRLRITKSVLQDVQEKDTLGYRSNTVSLYPRKSHV